MKRDGTGEKGVEGSSGPPDVADPLLANNRQVSPAIRDDVTPNPPNPPGILLLQKIWRSRKVRAQLQKVIFHMNINLIIPNYVWTCIYIYIYTYIYI
jgi:hypothetical protein